MYDVIVLLTKEPCHCFNNLKQVSSVFIKALWHFFGQKKTAHPFVTLVEMNPVSHTKSISYVTMTITGGAMTKYRLLCVANLHFIAWFWPWLTSPPSDEKQIHLFFLALFETSEDADAPSRAGEVHPSLSRLYQTPTEWRLFGQNELPSDGWRNSVCRGHIM